MIQAHPISDEQLRLGALHALDILDSSPEPAFDALAALAARLLDCPIGAITMMDERRQWIKASVGMTLMETPRHLSFCDHTIRSGHPLIVENAADDARFRDLAFVAEDGIRFYAGAPLHARHPSTGKFLRVGAICALDHACRTPNAAQREALTHLGTVAEALLAARTRSLEAVTAATSLAEQARALRRRDSTFRQAERIAAIGSWRYDIAARRLDWSEGVFRIHELPTGTVPPLDGALDYYPGEDREVVARAFAHAVETGASFDFETGFITATGNHRRVRSMGEAEKVNGRLVAVTGVFQDVTERYRMEQVLRRSASTDSLTGIANRAAFDEALEQAMAVAAHGGGPLTLVLVDLDFFKQLNDTHGHAAGDDVLRATGERLRAEWLAGSIAARLGGDEFGLIVRDPKLCAGGDALTQRLLASLGKPVAGKDGPLPSAATLGFAAFDPAAHGDMRAFLHSADSALYEAKRAGRGTARRFSQAGRRADDAREAQAA